MAETEELFTYRLVPPRPTFVDDMTDAEAAAMSEHAEYWEQLHAEGDVVVYGLVLEPGNPWGLCVVRAADRNAVEALGRADPAVSSGTCTFAVGTMPRARLGPR
ncbi:MAG TPA: YciI family protein [Acidimicrobiales bacterium]|nr:YciI family protein [Acidimicrobiales bacterium]